MAVSEHIASDVRQDFYFAQCPEWLLDTEISPTAILVFLTLARFANGSTRSCYPSRTTISTKSRLSITTVDKCLKELVNVGAITVTARSRDGAQTSNLYRLHMIGPFGSIKSLTYPYQESGEGSSVESTEGVSPNFGEGTIQENQTRGTKRDISPSVDPLFERFWTAYPRKVGKGQARKAFEKAAKKVDPIYLIDAAEFYAEQRKGQDPQFTAHPTTWLNGERWLDDPSDLPAKPASKSEVRKQKVQDALSRINQRGLDYDRG